MRIVLFHILTLLTLNLYSQKIRFENASFDTVLQKAKIEKKIIFIDVSTEWCGSCKWMEQNTLRINEVTNFYNDHFINFQIDAEKGEGLDIAKKYNVWSFPTYLFITQEGVLLAKNTIGAQNVNEFIATAKKAIAVQSQRIPLSLLDKKFNSGDRNKAFLLNYLSRQVDERDECDTLVLNSYLNQLSNPELNKIENISLIANTPKAFAYRSRYFLLVLKNLPKVQLRLNTGRFYTLINQYVLSIANKDFFPIVNSKSIDSFKLFLRDYSLLYPFTIKNDPFYSPFKYQRIFFKAIKDSANYEKAVKSFLDKYLYSGLSNKIPLKIKESELFSISRNIYTTRLVTELNQIGLEYSSVFSNSKDLKQGIKILDNAAKLSSTSNNLFAKSKIVAKLGNTAEALELAKKAKQLALEQKVNKYFINTIDEFIKELEEK